MIWDKIVESYKKVEVDRKNDGKNKECPFLEEKKYVSRLKETIPGAYRFGESPFTTVQLLMIKEGEPLTLEDQKEFASCYFMITIRILKNLKNVYFYVMTTKELMHLDLEKKEKLILALMR